MKKRVRNKPLDVMFFSRVDQRGKDECWPWLGRLDHDGYGCIFLGGNKRATHVSLILAGKPRPSPRHGACHTCDNRGCVNPDHLWWGTHSDNMADMVSKGRSNSRKKLTTEDVRQIRELRGQATQAHLAKVFGVAPNTVSQIQQGRRWKRDLQEQEADQ